MKKMNQEISLKCWPTLGIRLVLFGVLSILLFSNVSFPQPYVNAHAIDRGYLTSIEDLEYISRQARWGVEPYATLVADFLSGIESPRGWEHGEATGAYEFNDSQCRLVGESGKDRFFNQQGGGHAVYAKMIAYHLTHNTEYAVVTRDKILELTTSFGFGGEEYSGANECILQLGFAVPLWIQAADLLEGEPIWTEADKRQFQNWLKDEVYRKVAWASRVRNNNWGAAGSLAASMIGDYLHDRNVILIEVEPYKELTPEEAFKEHNEMQLMRMNTVWQGDSQCDIWGIQPYGGIPDELRRGDTGCEQEWLLGEDDGSYLYQVTQVDHLVFHAEYLRRRGDTAIYDNVGADGSGSLLNAILFVISNPVRPDQSYEWDDYKTGILYVAYQYYEHEALRDAMYVGSVQRGGVTAYAQLTHPVTDLDFQ